jgi:S-adenosylmethionine synthetase
MKIVVSSGGKPVSELPIEIVERKGKGHPDSICDRAAEELSLELSRYYLEEYGRILHHNVDKCVLVGGQSLAYFGGGKVIEPMYLFLVGRAVGEVKGKPVPIGNMAVKHTKSWLSKEFRYLDVESDIIVDYKIRSGSADLIETFEDFEDVPKANDTSIGVSYAPLSETEKLVYEAEKLLNSTKIKRKFPAIGEDIKVMGIRKKNRIQLTIAVAMISSETKDADSYLFLKNEIGRMIKELASGITEKDVSVLVNAADNPRKRRFYLTVTGTSAEHGDDGQVGRGNRANGLITPYRPMSLEAASGKNPVSHVGKIYNVAARMIAESLVREEEILEASCYIVSRIGAPITRPEVVNIDACTEKSERWVRSTAEPVVEEVLEELPVIWRGFLDRKYELF